MFPSGRVNALAVGSRVAKSLFSASTPANGKWSASGQNYNLMVSNVTEHLFVND